MSEVYFYHLTRTPLEMTLPELLEKSRARGWTVLLRASTGQRLKWLDERLWTGPEASFEPHGLAGGPQDADQPVLLTLGHDCPNRAGILIAVDGAQVWVDEVARYQRVCIVFDGNDDASLTVARGQWKDLTDAGCPARYWSQESGSWAEKVSKNI